MELRFLGAARQVTGSRYYLDAGGLHLLIDCGIFQERHYLARNWEPSPVSPDSIDHLLLTHAHLDHAGLIPRLVREGFAGPVMATPATRDLAEIILADAAEILEEDAAYKKTRHEKEQRKGPYPEVPLYTADDVRAALPHFQPVPYDKPISLNKNVTVRYHDAGHILGSAMLELTIGRNGDARTVVFSGDIGEWNRPIVRDPSVFERADYVIMESTYGTREHEGMGEVEEQLCDVINSTVEAGGNIVIPTFAVERAQELLYYLSRLIRDDRIPHLLIFLDSPMAVDVTEVFRRYRQSMDAEARELLESGESFFRFPGLNLVRSTTESKAINRIRGSCIIMAGSGMCTAGRIKHHLVNNISRPECTVVFVGYQAMGTLGRELTDGRTEVRIHGAKRIVRARIAQIHGLSAHAGRSSLLKWVGRLKRPPKRVFLTHGEEDAANALGAEIRSRWGWPVHIPQYQEQVRLA
jgi:metallo-beta-lactamase family protein